MPEPGELVREVWVEWAREQPDAKPSWLVPWAELDAGQREVDARIESAVRAEARRGYPTTDLATLRASLANADMAEWDNWREQEGNGGIMSLPEAYHLGRATEAAVRSSMETKYAALLCFACGVRLKALNRNGSNLGEAFPRPSDADNA